MFKSLRTVRDVCFVALIMASPFLILVVFAHFQGSSTEVSALGAAFGAQSPFICEWVSPDGQDAIFVSGETRRLCHLEKYHVGYVKVGGRYMTQTRCVAKFVQRTYLLRA